ncbi:MAG: OsmC family protein [Spirosomataceae bacterium]
MKRTANANWQGSGKEGHGTLTTQSTVLSGSQYSFNTRFADGIGTNPEELVAAAHAGCFSMKLSFVIGAVGFTPDSIDTQAIVTLENGAIPNIHLVVKASVPGMSAEEFEIAAQDAKANCPISKLLNTDITMEATLV